MSNTLSIITPSYNQAQFIERTIQSVLSQAISDLEYVIIDGGSTDNTLEILKKYDTQVRWISERDHGQAHAVNKGFHQTSGEIIGWLNSDDLYYPEALHKVLAYFKAHPSIDIIYGNAHHIDANDQIIESYYTEAWNIARLKEVCYLCQPAVFFRRSVITRFGQLNEKLQYCMDYDYWLRLAYQGANFAYFPEILAESRLHADTKTIGSRIKVHAEINSMLKTHFQNVPNRWLSNYAHALADQLYSKDRSSRAFNRAIAFHVVKASLRWNKKIDLSLLSTALRCFFSSFLKKNH